MQETMTTIKDFRLQNATRTFQEDVILEGDIILENSKLVVNGLLWITDLPHKKSTVRMEGSEIVADKVLIDPILSKYQNSKIIGRELQSFDY